MKIRAEIYAPSHTEDRIMAELSQRIARLSHLLATLKPERKTRVADIGANPVHVPAYQFLLDQGGCEVIGFEPDPRAFKELQEQKNGSNETYLPFAVGDDAEHTKAAHIVDRMNESF